MRVKIKKIRYMLLATAFSLFAGCLSLAYAISPSLTKVYASATPSQYAVNEASIRVPKKNGDTYENGGLRFHTRMTETEYNTYKAGLEAGTTKTGLLLLPEAIARGEDLTLETTSVANADTSKAWSRKEENGVVYYEANVVLVGIPNSNEGTEMVVRPYVTIDGETNYFAEKWDTSIAGVARQLYDNETAQTAWGSDSGALTKEVEQTIQEAYLDRKVTLYESDGTTVSKTIMYGEKVDGSHLVKGEMYHKDDMTAFDYNTNVVKGDMTLYAVKEQNIISGAPALDLQAYTNNGYTITEVIIEGQSIPVNGSSIELPSSVDLGDNTITVTLLNSKGKEITAELSVSVVTQMISTPEELAAITPFYTGRHTSGYYKLANDIDVSGRTKDLRYGAWDGDWDNHAFSGVLDGNGHTITSQSYYCTGLFLKLDGATIKNVTIVDKWYNGGVKSPLIASVVNNSLLEDVYIELFVASSTYAKANDGTGIIASDCAQNNTFRNVVIDAVNVHVGEELQDLDLISMLGGNVNTTLGCRNNTFENCIVYAKSLANIGYHYDKEGQSNILHVYSSSEPLDGVSIITEIHDHVYTKWLPKSGYDQLVCRICNIATDVRFDKVADDLEQSLILDSEKVVLSIAGVSDYANVVSVKYGDYYLGDDLKNLTIPADMQADTQKHGKQNLSVVVTDTLTGAEHTLTVPAVLVTDEITSLEQLSNIVRRPADLAAGTQFHIYGYYQLIRNNTDVDYVPSGIARDWNAGGNSGFHGTIDGLGYTLKGNFGARAYQDGPFGFLQGATIKNLTIESTEYNGESYTCMLATQMYRSTLDNVKIRVLGGLGTIEVGSNKALLIAGGTDMYTVFNNVTIDAGGLNVGYLSNNNVPKFTGHCSFTAGSYKGLTKDVAIADNLTINASMSEQHRYVWEEGTTEDYYKCELCGTVVRTFDKTVSAATREILLTGGSALDVSGISEYVSVSDVSYGGYSLGSNLSSLAKNDSLLSATDLHGENKTLTVIVVDDTGYSHTISVPATLITKVIYTMEEFETATRFYGTTKTGYYLLGDDITSVGYQFKSVGSTKYDGSGFAGVIDGRNKTITWDMQATNQQFGLFGTINRGTLKNVTINAINYVKDGTAWGRCVLGYIVYNSTFTNVVINVDGVGTDDAGDGLGIIVGNAFNGCTWTNVTINSKIAMGSVFGMADITPIINFVNCTLNTTYYKTLTRNNKDTLGNLVINVTPENKEVTLTNRQELVVANSTNKLNIGSITNFTATSIKTADGVYDFGTDITNLDLSSMQDAKDKHGDNTLVIIGSEPGIHYTITAPVCIITAKISTTQQLYDAIYPKDGCKDGYYKLANSINFTAAEVLKLGENLNYTTTGVTATYDANKYFSGTLDGAGFTITAQTTSYGVFNALNGATIKNVTITDAWSTGSAQWVTLLAKSVRNTSFEGVTIKLSAKAGSYDGTGTGSGRGWLVMSEFVGNTLTNVTIDTTCKDSLNAVGSLFGTGYDNAQNTFTNVTLKATSLVEVGQKGGVVYTADDVDGFTLKTA